ncbi:MAG: type II restriction endonuclease [Thermoplasmata archaeon]|nr:type II restriction endonuclease [Thermoplasmata archaeon]
MVRLGWYKGLGLSVASQDAVRHEFYRTLLRSNRSADFFVNWKKVERNVDALSEPLRLLSSVGSSEDPKEALSNLIRETQAAVPIIPLLIAWRKHEWRMLVESAGQEANTLELDFSGKAPLSEEEINRVTNFAVDSGVVDLLRRTKDLESYLRGVEVGMDTNARKNRSGTFMEARVTPFIRKAVATAPGWTEVKKQPFARVCPESGAEGSDVASRTFDFMAKSEKRRIAFEMNFYDQVGSKPLEIVSSYLHQADELKRYGWDFVWVTDGPAWESEPTRLRDSFEKLDAVLNLSFCRRGVLDAILSSE